MLYESTLTHIMFCERISKQQVQVQTVFLKECDVHSGRMLEQQPESSEDKESSRFK